jgi:hypothetical protein
MKKILLTVLRIAVSLGLLSYLVFSLDIEKIAANLSQIWSERPDCLAALGLGAIVLVVLEAFRLQQILLVQGIRSPLPRLIRYCFIGMFFNNFFPTTVGGDVVKGYYLSRDSGSAVGPYVALFVVRIIGIICLVLVAATALIFGYDLLPSKLPGVILLIILLLIAFLIIFFVWRRFAAKFLFILKPIKNKIIRRKVLEVYRIFHSHHRFPTRVGLAALATFGIEFLTIALNYLIVQGLGEHVPFANFLLLIPLIAVATVIPSLNGLGVREGAYVYFFADLIGLEKAGALSFIMLVMVIFLGAIGGLVYLVSGSADKARPKPPDPREFEGLGDGGRGE